MELTISDNTGKLVASKLEESKSTVLLRSNNGVLSSIIVNGKVSMEVSVIAELELSEKYIENDVSIVNNEVSNISILKSDVRELNNEVMDSIETNSEEVTFIVAVRTCVLDVSDCVSSVVKLDIN